MPTKPAIPAQVKRHIAAEAGSRECEVVELLRGCYGSVDYMVSSYGYTAEYVQSVVDSLSEMVTYINDEYDISLQEGDIIDVMLEFADLHREAWTDLIA